MPSLAWTKKNLPSIFIINFVEKLRLPMYMFYVFYHAVSPGNFSLWFMFKKLRRSYYPLSAFAVLRNPEYRNVFPPPPVESYEI